VVKRIKMKKENKEIISKWKNIRIKTETIKRVRVLKANLEMSTYDDVLNYLMEKENV